MSKRSRSRDASHFILPHASGGGGPSVARSAKDGGRGVGRAGTLLAKVKRPVRRPLHHPASQDGPPPPLSRGRKQHCIVLAMRFFDSHPSYEQARPKNLAASSDRRQIDPAVEGRIHHDRRGVGWVSADRRVTHRSSWWVTTLAAANPPEKRKKRKQNAERRNFTNLRACTRRASSGTRTPSGVPLRLSSKGLTHPKDSAPDQASRSAAPRMAGVSRRRRPRLQRAPRVPVMVPAGMMSEPPGSQGDEPLPAGAASRSRRPLSGGRRPSRGARRRGIYSPRRACQRSSPRR